MHEKMDITMIAVVSADHYIADRHGNISSWASEADSRHLKKMKASFSLLVMGSTTYDLIKPQPQPGVLRVVLTSRPEEYSQATVPDQLEFVSLSAQQTVDKYARTYDSALLMGGAEVYTDFMRSKLIDTVLLTVEPIELGEGTPLFTDSSIKLSGSNVTQLSDTTELRTYKLSRDPI